MPTRLRLLALIAIVCAAVAWSAAAVVDSVAGRYLPLPATASGAIWLLAVAVGMWGWIIRPRLLRRPGHEPLPPIVAARTAALALAGSRVGAGVVGCYGGVALFLLPDRSVAAAQSGLIVCGLTVVGAAALVAVSLWLEQMCRIPDDGESGDAADTDTSLGGIAGSAERVAQ
jgi:hypothetical protein